MIQQISLRQGSQPTTVELPKKLNLAQAMISQWMSSILLPRSDAGQADILVEFYLIGFTKYFINLNWQGDIVKRLTREEIKEHNDSVRTIQNLICVFKIYLLSFFFCAIRAKSLKLEPVSNYRKNGGTVKLIFQFVQRRDGCVIYLSAN